MTADTTTFWVPDEPIKYEIRKSEPHDGFNGGVVVERHTGTEFPEVAVMEMQREADTMRLAQVDGDLDAAKQIEADEKIIADYRRYARRPFPGIWAQAWKVAIGR